MAEKKNNQGNAPEEQTTEVTTAQKSNVAIGENDIMKKLKAQGMADFKAKDGHIKGLESVDRTDLKIPVYQLLQPNSDQVLEEKAKAGQFWNTATDSAVDVIRGVLINMTKTRVRWPEEYKKGSKPLCRSFNGEHGEGEPGILCAKCPYKDFGEANEAPKCRQGYNWLGLDLNESLKPYRYTAISSGVIPTKNFLTDLVGMGYEMFIYEITISSVKEKNDKGTYYVPKYDITDVISKETALQAETKIDTYKAMLEEDLRLDLENTMSEEMDDENLGNGNGSGGTTAGKAF